MRLLLVALSGAQVRAAPVRRRHWMNSGVRRQMAKYLVMVNAGRSSIVPRGTDVFQRRMVLIVIHVSPGGDRRLISAPLFKSPSAVIRQGGHGVSREAVLDGQRYPAFAATAPPPLRRRRARLLRYRRAARPDQPAWLRAPAVVVAAPAEPAL